jgi:hypothetical protein
MTCREELADGRAKAPAKSPDARQGDEPNWRGRVDGATRRSPEARPGAEKDAAMARREAPHLREKV